MSERKIRFSCYAPGPNPREGTDWAAGAEKLGFDFVWAADHLTELPPATAIMDAWTVLADIGARTKRVRLATGVIDVQRIHPARVVTRSRRACLSIFPAARRASGSSCNHT